MMAASGVFQRILVPTDFSPYSEEAWRLARRVAAADGELVLVHVLVHTPLFAEGGFTAEWVQVFEASRKWAQEQLDRWAQEARDSGSRVRTLLREGVPHQEIVAAATEEDVQLIILGTHGRGGLNRAFLGSVADRVIRLAPCPVLSVREGVRG